MIMRSVVVLPAPFGPMKPYSAPTGTARSRLSTATVDPNVLVTPASEMAGFTTQLRNTKYTAPIMQTAAHR